jgi:hypothetical protein
MLCNLTREAGTEPGQRRPRPIGQAEHGNRCLYRTRGDVNNPAKPALDHRVDHSLDEVEGGQHVRIKRLDPGLTGPVTEITGRRPTCIVNQNIHLPRCIEDSRPPLRLW